MFSCLFFTKRSLTDFIFLIAQEITGRIRSLVYCKWNRNYFKISSFLIMQKEELQVSVPGVSAGNHPTENRTIGVEKKERKRALGFP